MNKSEEINDLALSLIKAQTEMGAAKKETVNPYFKKKYADLSEIISVIKDPLNANGLSFLQPIEDGMVKTLLLHESGQWIQSGGTKIVSDKQTAQSQGSGITYARRYDLQSMLSIPAEDDDGQCAMPEKPNPTPKTTPVKPKAPKKEYTIYQQSAVDKMMEYLKTGEKCKEYLSGMGFPTSYELSSEECDGIINDINSKIEALAK